MYFLDGAGREIKLGDTVSFMSKGACRMGTVIELTWKRTPEQETNKVKVRSRSTYWDQTLTFSKPSNLWVQDQ